jgi:hypothetical protein
MIIEFRQLFDRNLGHGVVENLQLNLVRRNEIMLRTSAQPAAMSAALSFGFISATLNEAAAATSQSDGNPTQFVRHGPSLRLSAHSG